MRKIPLGISQTLITDFCLGTMTWGRQTDQEAAHIQIEMSLEAGITCMDTAEMYPVNPVRAETVGVTETILGAWNAKHPARRGDYVLATKITGQNDAFVRQGQEITAASFTAALDASLKRLQTDYIDLYQLHWPNRGSYHFRQNWAYAPKPDARSSTRAHILDILQAAQKAIDAGKIRHLGLSNETAWGIGQWLEIATTHSLPRVMSVQNEYSLLCRLYDTDLAELGVNEGVTLLAYSPLAAGLLTGKYADGQIPPASRMAGNGDLGGRATARAHQAVASYLDLAKRHGIDPIHMALAFSVTRPFPVCSIFGATDQAQLAHILKGLDTKLAPDLLAEIDALHRQFPMPF